MLKIVEVHACERARGEYLVLQNHGLTSVSLKGWAVCTDSYFHDEPAAAARDMFVFQQDVVIKPRVRVVLFTGQGGPGWVETTDAKMAYIVYWGRNEPVWRRAEQVHLLHVATSRKVDISSPDLVSPL